MSSPPSSDFDDPSAYEITVRGNIASGWRDRLEGMTITHLTLDDDTIYSVLTGELTDQAALSGVLNTLYELRVALVTVTKLPLPGSIQQSISPTRHNQRMA